MVQAQFIRYLKNELRRAAPVVMCSAAVEAMFAENRTVEKVIDYLAENDFLQSAWYPIETAPRHEVRFVCREKRKSHVQFEAAIFEDVESWEMPSTCYCLQNMTTDEPLTGAWEDYEWKPMPEGGE